MTKQDFIHYLSHPESLNGNSIGDLEKLVKEYPYFQTGRLLYLKNLHNENSIDFEKNLHITSAYAPGGKVLYNLIKKAKKPEVKQPVELQGKQPVEQPVTGEKREENPKSSILNPESTPVVQNDKKDEFDELQLLEKEMLREAYRTSLTVDLLKDPAEPETGNRKLETGNRKPETHSFSDWLKVVGGQTPASAVEEKAFEKKQKEDLVDKFILDQAVKTEPRPKAEFYSADAMAKKSIQDNETFVSETLAGIYLRQGNLPKALRAYEILLVKYPEKIHIFAPLLEKIKKLLEDQNTRK